MIEMSQDGRQPLAMAEWQQQAAMWLVQMS
jgi:hypothetical protein